ncbi:DinB family protein [Bacillus benzoevorans]|uniref:DinB-like domain-containing protein n=1 Tax=Bacillus benzoevorans TaxID=1456 RepID=A0A7X0LU24_9BACI|nr:DinB family protein [Bacillus benzoevorans]MBB6444010.1 hypothetical protein [Bacillus benzoevorans]
MSELLKKQFNLGRTGLFPNLEGLTDEQADVQLVQLPNTIRWQAGHILTAAENFLFGTESQLPEEYQALFGYGSKPSAWNGEVPSIEILIGELKGQLERINAIPNERFEENLPEPILGNATYGELFSFTAFHELTHIGQIHTMQKLVQS